MTLKNMKNKENLFDPSLKAGLYLITCIPIEKHYVGESEYVTRRLNAHKSTLRRGIHENNEMQRDFDKYGINAFLFQKLYFGKSLPKEKRQNFETLILSTLPEQTRYNFFIDWRQRGSKTNPFYGKHHNPESRLLLSESKQGVSFPFAGHCQSDCVKTRVSEANLGKKDRRKSVFIDSIFYESIAKASEQLGLSRRLIRERCHSAEKRFENYQWALLIDNESK
uniref:GIY-YIG homing endonuclease n=1 Tax=Hydrocytium acuminatum TaxID=1745963 RepID=UPI002A7F8F14|nr:GIY-YIG homing endonuclease [Hydrocytium acuminatum]WOR09550.1 GIY-YIG homing endonuclease [Hydrocytium acuminatum]